MAFTLTPKQEAAIKKAVYWFKNESETKQFFTISGYAGTGKTTIVKKMIERIDIDEEKITYVALTGKAALQLNMNGNKAITIHRLIYHVEEDENGQAKYVLRKKDDLSYLSLIIVDEVGMADKKLMDDLKTFGIPIIALGDHGQLGPIGEDNGLLRKPDVLLTEIHRQAQENPIIYLSMLAREGKPIPYGKYGSEVIVLPKKHKLLNLDLLLRANQVLCSYNKTRRMLNERMRGAKGFTNPLPVIGDKVICTKNNWEEEVDGINLINGLIGEVKSVKKEYNNVISMDFQPEFSKKNLFRDLPVLTNGFLGFQITPKQRREFNIFDFGEAITVHKSQGSQWDNLCVFHEPMGKTQADRNRGLYTAITRAAERLILIKERKIQYDCRKSV